MIDVENRQRPAKIGESYPRVLFKTCAKPMTLRHVFFVELRIDDRRELGYLVCVPNVILDTLRLARDRWLRGLARPFMVLIVLAGGIED
jgi:hypothetical protein